MNVSVVPRVEPHMHDRAQPTSRDAGPRRADRPSATARPGERDVDALWRLVEPHDRALRALAFRLLGDRDRMDDVLQIAYVKAHRALPTFRGEAGLGTWLYRIVYNACLDELRRAGRAGHAEQVPLEVLDRQPQLPVGAPRTDPAATAVLRVELASALASLSPELRAAVLLVDAEGMPYDEAAEVLGVPRGTLASQVHRARARLRDHLTANGVDGW